jgi:hypothetical protein
VYPKGLVGVYLTWSGPANDLFAAASTIGAGVTTGTVVGASREPGEPAFTEAGPLLSVWYKTVVPAGKTSATVSSPLRLRSQIMAWRIDLLTCGVWAVCWRCMSGQIDLAGSEFDTYLSVYTGSSLDTLTPVVNSDDCTVAVVTSCATFTVAENTQLYIQVSAPI